MSRRLCFHRQAHIVAWKDVSSLIAHHLDTVLFELCSPVGVSKDPVFHWQPIFSNIAYICGKGRLDGAILMFRTGRFVDKGCMMRHDNNFSPQHISLDSLHLLPQPIQIFVVSGIVLRNASAVDFLEVVYNRGDSGR